ncbi:MAG: Na/Pi symporter, partial [Gammaproteobacteria bacterium]
MQENFIVIGMLAGGVGIFLLAVGMITDGLKMAAGSSLRAILGRWTRSPARGIATGFTITAIVQSSSAITVATIGFVNAGILTLNQALGIVFGANIGTTVTGWLVAIIGFEINISALALPLIGIGMALRLTGGNSRRGAIGTALAGFGLFFIGIQVLKDAFEGIVATMDVQRFTLEGVRGLLICLALGFIMTVLTQSSSAAIAIILTAATGGLLGIYAAGAMVIGANVGTTSTAVLSVIGATANAKRVAGAHLVFNGVTAVVALLLLPLMFYLVNGIARLLNIEPVPAVSLALFHTIFNVLGVVLMLPFIGKLSAMLQKRFTTQEEVLGRARFLDKNVSE